MIALYIDNVNVLEINLSFTFYFSKQELLT